MNESDNEKINDCFTEDAGCGMVVAVQPVGGSTNEPCHGIETNNKWEPAVSVSVYG